MTVCRWCGTDIDKHTPAQLEAAEYFLQTLGPKYAYDASIPSSYSPKLSKHNQQQRQSNKEDDDG